MGCGGSKSEEFPVVTLCRERKNFLKAASEQRYALAAAHVAYLQSLRDIGDALRKFADQDIFIPTTTSTSSFSPLSSPILTLPTKSKKNNNHNNNHISSSSSPSSPHGSHIHLSSGSELSSPSSDHIHHHDHDHDHHHTPEPESEPEPEPNPEPDGYNYNYNYPYPYPQDWTQQQQRGVNNTYAYYMKKSAPRGKSIIYEQPESRHVAENGQWPGPGPTPTPYEYGYPNGGGFFGYPPENSVSRPPPAAPAPPSPPRVSTWDFLNFFDTVDSGYSGYGYYGLGSRTSSPDSKEVREREGIPELEDETEQETVKEVKKKKVAEEEEEKVKVKEKEKEKVVEGRDFGEGTSNSKAVPLQQVSSSEGSSKTVRFHSDSSLSPTEKESSHDSVVSKSSPPRKKGVSFEIDHEVEEEEEEEAPTVTAVEVDGESSVLSSSLTTLSPHGTRDLKEVVLEIRDEFETASNHGKEVALLLEACKPPYRSSFAAFRVIFSRFLQTVAPSTSPSHPPSEPPIQFSSRTMKLAKAYCGEPGKDFKPNPENLSSTLEKLYAWEKKLYKEVKDEERLRAIYEKQCKRLKRLDDRGAESSKIDATEASIRNLLTKINICIRSIETISGRIHKLRDEELQPQLAALINGLIRMWKFMLQCHQKQFQAIMDSKTQSLKLNTGLQRDEGLKAIIELEGELLNWCSQFNNWVKTQKSYVENLNGWLTKCLLEEPEVTADGIVPFSPSRVGAPLAFIICNDWHQAMTRISGRGVADAMREFAQKLHELWERQDEEQRRRIRAEYLRKDFEKQLRTLRTEMGGSEHEHDKVSGKTALSKLTSDSGVSPLDDLKVDLDSMKKKLHEERARHKEAMKLVRDAASNSLQAGLVPIFKTLKSFTSEVVKAHEQVRLQNDGDS